MPRASVVASFYGGLCVVGFFWHAMAQDSNDLWRLDPSQSWATLAWTPLVGLAVGLAVVRLFRVLEPKQAWIRNLNSEFGTLFDHCTTREIVIVALASSLGEELLFRGAMLDAWGVVVSSLVFAALHIPPKRELWPWTLSSLVLGVVLALMTLATGNLGAAVVCHFVINFLNLRHISRGARLREAALVRGL